ncbi:hypothetical protein K466DRAFT_592695 [Polyporus arcularius HHB13444]|uniref:Uncharacterized protein n=1 Tax=Polyporus arcularius HHB13444 TaxID=1314778 RepID=A0A5C3NQ01_9APHY|nr:hypothetical protein K466DRAFT_592695 [Polyporus arcularius HHB13444]
MCPTTPAAVSRPPRRPPRTWGAISARGSPSSPRQLHACTPTTARQTLLGASAGDRGGGGEAPACVVTQDGHIASMLCLENAGAPLLAPRLEFVPVQAALGARSVRRDTHAAACPSSRPHTTSATASSLSQRARHTPSGALLSTTSGLLAGPSSFPRRVTSLPPILSQDGPPSWKCQSRDTPVPARSSSPTALLLCVRRDAPRRCLSMSGCWPGTPSRVRIRVQAHIPEFSSSVFAPCTAAWCRPMSGLLRALLAELVPSPSTSPSLSGIAICICISSSVALRLERRDPVLWT